MREIYRTAAYVRKVPTKFSHKTKTQSHEAFLTRDHYHHHHHHHPLRSCALDRALLNSDSDLIAGSNSPEWQEGVRSVWHRFRSFISSSHHRRFLSFSACTKGRARNIW